jgi:hypothetical protein
MKYDESLKKKNGEQIIVSTDPIHLKLCLAITHSLSIILSSCKTRITILGILIKNKKLFGFIKNLG